MTRQEQRERREALIAQIRAMAGKMSYFEIAYTLGYTPNYITHLASKNGISLAFFDRGLTEAKTANLIALISQGMQNQEIAPLVGLSVRGVERQITVLRNQGVAIPHRKRGGERRSK